MSNVKNSSKSFKNKSKYINDKNALFDDFVSKNSIEKLKVINNKDSDHYLFKEKSNTNIKKFKDKYHQNSKSLFKCSKSNNNINEKKEIYKISLNQGNLEVFDKHESPITWNRDLNLKNLKVTNSNSCKNLSENIKIIKKNPKNQTSNYKINFIEILKNEDIVNAHELQAFSVTGKKHFNLSKFTNDKSNINLYNCSDKQFYNPEEAKNPHIMYSKSSVDFNKKIPFYNTSKNKKLKNALDSKKLEELKEEKLKNKLQLESNNKLNCHYKKSIINDYFEKKESENEQGLKFNSDINQALEQKVLSQIKTNDNRKGIFMLKKDYFIQNLIEKNSQQNLQNFIEELNQDNLKRTKNISGININFNKIKIENEFENEECQRNINKKYYNHNHCSLSKNPKYEIKSSINLLENSSRIVKEDDDLDPKIVKDTFSIRNFSNLKLIRSESRLQLYHKKKLSACSNNSSNFVNFNLKMQSNDCNFMIPRSKSFTKVELFAEKIPNENDIFTNCENIELKNISKEKEYFSGLDGRYNFIQTNDINNYYNTNIINNANKSLNAFHFDKACKLNYYHARELSAFTRNRKNKPTLNSKNDLENSKKDYEPKLIPSSLDFKITHIDKNEIKNRIKKTISKIRPNTANIKKPKNVKIFENEYIIEKTIEGFENEEKDEPLTIETIFIKENKDENKVNGNFMENIKDYVKKIDIDDNDLNNKEEENEHLKNPLIKIQEENISEKDKHANKLNQGKGSSNNEESSKLTNNPNENMKNNPSEFTKHYLQGSSSNFHKIKSISLQKHISNSNSKDAIKNNNLIKKNIYIKEKSFNKIGFENSNKLLNSVEGKRTFRQENNTNSSNYLNLSNSLTKHLNNNVINHTKSSNLTKHINDNKEQKICENEKIDNKENNNKKTKEKETLNEFLKLNVYLDSNQFNYDDTDENLNEKDSVHDINCNNTFDKKDKNKYPTEKKDCIRVDKGLHCDIGNQLKIQNRLKSSKCYPSINEIKKKKNFYAFDINDYFYSESINYEKLNLLKATNYKSIPKSASRVNADKKINVFNSNLNRNKPPPNSFRNVFTAGKIKLSTIILSNVKS